MVQRKTKIANLKQRLNANNKTGHKGVCFDRTRGVYMAYIMLYGKQKTLGYFDEIKDAVKARKIAEEELYIPIIEEQEKGKANE